jgi:hypothetical protein
LGERGKSFSASSSLACRARSPDHHVSIARIGYSEASFYRNFRLTPKNCLKLQPPGFSASVQPIP